MDSCIIITFDRDQRKYKEAPYFFYKNSKKQSLICNFFMAKIVIFSHEKIINS